MAFWVHIETSIHLQELCNLIFSVERERAREGEQKSKAGTRSMIVSEQGNAGLKDSPKPGY